MKPFVELGQPVPPRWKHRETMANPADSSPPWDVAKEPPRSQPNRKSAFRTVASTKQALELPPTSPGSFATVDNSSVKSGSSKSIHSFTTAKSGTFVDINRPLLQLPPAARKLNITAVVDALRNAATHKDVPTIKLAAMQHESWKAGPTPHDKMCRGAA